MKKMLLIFSLLPLFSLAQTDTTLSNTEIDEGVLTSASGFKIRTGDFIILGTGSLQDGNFRFVRVNRNSIFATPKNSRNDLNRRFSGQKFKVVKIVKHGNKKHGYNYLAIINIGITRYEVDVDNAITFSEIVVPEEYRLKPKTAIEAPQKGSVADELLKLKKLRDENIITEQEFQDQKKKLLNK
ncbi:MAG: SHOCT domain-containing protein [Bacteroidota bacterium]|nr:SHOCT domain-containing protein [Bacteroidota bacterium]